MAGIPKFIHKIQLKDQNMVQVFDRLHKEIKIESVDPMEDGLMLTFSTREPYEITDWITILTFAGRTEDGKAIPNDGQTIYGLVAEANSKRQAEREGKR